MSTTGSNGYCHVTRGRIRVRVANLKGNQEAARSLELLLASQPGIEHVRANPVTGNVLVRFDPDTVCHEDVLVSLSDLGHYPDECEGVRLPVELEKQLSDIGMKLARVALKQALSSTPAAILLELI